MMRPWTGKAGASQLRASRIGGKMFHQLLTPVAGR
jgi:hypothetical protein